MWITKLYQHLQAPKHVLKHPKHVYQICTARCMSNYYKFAEHKPIEKIRNIGISAHIDSGKTTLTERILFYTGRIDEMHEVKGKDHVGAVMDSMELERQRGITIQSAATYTLWKDYNINIIDTPGHVDFTVEVERALRVLDGAILVLCGVGGVQCQSMTVNRQMERYKVPCLAFINKLDRIGADPYVVLKSIRKKLGHNAAFLHLPIGKDASFQGIIDILDNRAIYFNGEYGEEVVMDDVPPDMVANVRSARNELLEKLCDVDETLADLYLNEKPITTEDMKVAVRRTCIKRTFTPVLLGTALKNKGVQPLLDAVLDYLPNPSEVQNYGYAVIDGVQQKEKTYLDPTRSSAKPFVALSFKMEGISFGQLTYLRAYQGTIAKGDTIFNVRTDKKIRIARLVRLHSNNLEDVDRVYAGDIFAIHGMEAPTGDTFTNSSKYKVSLESIHIAEPVVSMSIVPKSIKNTDTFMKAIKRFVAEDPTFRYFYETDNKESIVSGMGELHLDIYAQRMEREYKCPVILGKPKVAFRECLLQSCFFDFWHRRQTGGHGEYARVIGLMEPLPPEMNTLIDFVDETIGTNVPAQYVPGVKKGLLAMLEKGALAGCKLSGMRFRLQDGASHCVDSSEYAFMLAAKGAVSNVMEDGVWHLLEPIMTVEVSCPCEFQGAVMGSISKRHGQIVTAEPGEDWSTIVCEVPLNDMFGYAGDLRSISQGKGEFTMEYSRYAPCRSETQAQLVADYRARLEAENASKKHSKKHN